MTEIAPLPSKYEWEQVTLDKLIMKTGNVTHAAIVSFSDGELRAAGPKDFRPDIQGVQHIINALSGDVSGLAKEGINLGAGTKLYTPGKVEEGKVIFGTDGFRGGCTVFKTRECVLILVFNQNPAIANRLGYKVAIYMEKDNKK